MSESVTKSSQNRVVVNTERCKGCRFCIEFCPQHLLYESDETNSRGYHIVQMTESEKCIGCDMCSMICPEFAIHVVKDNEESE
ncbi:MAG TPA: 4Fe-4S binding protein [Dehalococcoidia bacterium]|nr:4Fe-4S binding protein [Dehalococcoidia bacterium]